jgi:hypothetical protein
MCRQFVRSLLNEVRRWGLDIVNLASFQNLLMSQSSATKYTVVDTVIILLSAIVECTIVFSASLAWLSSLTSFIALLGYLSKLLSRLNEFPIVFLGALELHHDPNSLLVDVLYHIC